MFDAGYEGSGCVSSEASSNGPAYSDGSTRKQYTLKGVESETIRLMRDAAGREGMKIGSWVSLRMREAAEKALSAPGINSKVDHKLPPPDNADAIVHQLCMAINAQREEAEERFLRLERELHEITSVQRTILSSLLTAK